MNDNKNGFNPNEEVDLGSSPFDEEFDPFDTTDDFSNEIVQKVEKNTQNNKRNKNTATANTVGAVIAKESEEVEKQTLYDKLPIFQYAGATENIDDTSKTFDELRIEKAIDFPELEDGKRVSWSIEYGKIIKSVTDPKSISIGKMKSDIETSKEFTDSLKKAKDKNPDCKIKPRVTAQIKGTTSVYKGIFTNMSELEAASKVISIIPSNDGKVYEIRNTEMGRFITPVYDCGSLDHVRAGFIPALPLIPMDMVMRVVSFFRYYVQNGVDKEVLVNIYWDKQNKEFFLDVPEQIVTKVSVDSHINNNYSNDRYIHYMDIHSHNSMKAFFSTVDDKDEKSTRLYSVIGNLDKYFPKIKTRISNGGNFLEIDSSEVFEYIARPFPHEWKEKVHFKSASKEAKDKNESDVPWYTIGVDDV